MINISIISLMVLCIIIGWSVLILELVNVHKRTTKKEKKNINFVREINDSRYPIKGYNGSMALCKNPPFYLKVRRTVYSNKEKENKRNK